MPTDPAPSVPSHVAFIMDGNGRWARQRRLPRAAGHVKGAAQVRTVIEHCAQRGVQAVTLYAFSTENWARPANEVGALMALFARYLQNEIADMQRNGVQLRVIGDRSVFSQSLQQAISQAEAATAGANRLVLQLAVNYGGRAELLGAMQRWLQANPGAEPAALTEAALAAYLFSPDLPAPDLLVRTAGERRLSNFLLWQTAYTELYFTDTLWPDFDAKALDAALAWFASRVRRFGKTTEQVLNAAA
jgi:undecaprenyl diphosphate synthase